jgi:hypothetical protein
MASVYATEATITTPTAIAATRTRRATAHAPRAAVSTMNGLTMMYSFDSP